MWRGAVKGCSMKEAGQSLPLPEPVSVQRLLSSVNWNLDRLSCEKREQ